MELAKIGVLLQTAGGPAFAAAEGRLLLCTPEARELGLEPEAELERCLPGLVLPAAGEGPAETERELGGRRWLLRSAALEEGVSLCFLRPVPEQGPVLTDAALQHTAGAIRAALQELTLALDSLTEAPMPPESPEGRSAASALRSVFRLCRTAWELERFAALRAGKRALCLSRIMAVSAAERLCADLAGLLRTAKLELTWELPEKDFPAVVDWPLISAMLRELVANAAAAAGDGRISLKLVRSGRRELCFTVGNRSAAPLPPGLFERFAAPREDLSGGLGLGLSLVEAGARAHGGSVLLSADDEGFVTAILRVRGAEEEQARTLCSPVVEPLAFDPDLVALSSVLPPELYHPDAIF